MFMLTGLWRKTRLGDSLDIFVDCYLKHNLGDDLFLFTLLERYAGREDVRFHIWLDSSYQYLGQRYSNISVHVVPSVHGNLLHRMSQQRQVARLRVKNLEMCDASVQIGGSIFMEWHGGNLMKRLRDFRYWRATEKWLKQLYSIPEASFVIGSNFGPWQTNHYKHVIEQLIGRYCTDVCFRDKYSANLFAGLSNVRSAPDVLLGTKMPQIEKSRKLFISVIDLQRKVKQIPCRKAEYEDWLIKQAQLMAQREYEIVLCSFCSYEGDSKIATDLSRRLRKTGVETRVLEYDTNDREILAEIASSDYVIASRFHAMILALVSGCKVLPVLYSNKTRYVLEDLGYSMDSCVDLLSDDSDVFDHDIVDCKIFPVNEAVKASERQFQALDEWLDAAR